MLTSMVVCSRLHIQPLLQSPQIFDCYLLIPLGPKYYFQDFSFEAFGTIVPLYDLVKTVSFGSFFGQDNLVTQVLRKVMGATHTITLVKQSQKSISPITPIE